MTPSIIKRFARYHHLDAMFDAPIDDSAATIERLCVLHFGSCDALDVMCLVQALTRIDDAETLIAEVGAVTSVSDGPAFFRVRARLDILANELLVQADIDDPQRWREVKDEEA